MITKKIKYKEGQWFAVPLRTGSYSIGIIVRGSYINGGGLGYFFGPRYKEAPDGKATISLKPAEAILVTRFSGLGISTKRWPLIFSQRPFSRNDWPLPKFWQEDLLIPEKGFVREYGVTQRGRWFLIQEIRVNRSEIKGLPKDSDMGGGAVEIRLTELLGD